MSDPPPDGRPLNRMFAALSHPRRRRVLSLVGEQEFATGDDYSVEAVASETDDPERLRTELYHHHLPKLAEMGYIEWDPETLAFRRGSEFDEIQPLIDLLRTHQAELPGGWP